MQVQERNDFLASMQRAGRGAEYERQIRAELAERLFRLKELGVDIGKGQGHQGQAEQQQGGAAPLPPWQMGQAGTRRR